MRKIIKKWGINGSPLLYKPVRGGKIGVVDKIRRSDLATGEGPDLSAAPGDFALVRESGTREIVRNDDRDCFYIEGHDVFSRDDVRLEEAEVMILRRRFEDHLRKAPETLYALLEEFVNRGVIKF